MPEYRSGRGRPRRAARAAILLTVAATAAAMFSPADALASTPTHTPAPTTAPSTPAAVAASHSTKTAKRSASLPIVAATPVPAGDEVATGRGDADGWHLYAAASAAPDRWQPLATLAPSQINPGGETWIGRQCITGDGRYVVAVVAPWSANNSPSGMDRGGVAYVVDAHTGAARPLVTGVSLHYFNPSCGAGSTAALTRFVGSDEQSTQLVDVDAAGARIRSVTTRPGELTGAVPAADGGILAVRGHSVVKVAQGRETTLAAVAGQPFDLVADADGGAAFLLGQGKSATIWSTDARGHARQVGTGDFEKLALFRGGAGQVMVAGADHVAADAGVEVIPASSGQPEAVSWNGTLTAIAATTATTAATATAATTAVTATTAAGATTADPGRLPLTLSRVGGVPEKPWTPDAAAPATVGLPGFLTDSGAIVAAPSPSTTTTADPHRPQSSARAATATASGVQSASARAATAQTLPYSSLCSVARNDPYLQAMQPSPEQVAWAANMAGRGDLQGSYARPANYANLNLTTGYSPSLDFPLPAPFGQSGQAIPREVLEAIFAQESNFNQASWHSMQGVPGNPLIADYYAAGGGYVAGAVTDASGAPNPDCGYGLGQVTTGMRTGQTAYDLQRKVAVDYAEDAAASAQILAQKWNELAAAGIVAGDGNPAELENWFLAVWDYNSGLHANTGSGPWGLGWANNPANPAYPYNRHPFLHQDVAGVPSMTYGDAATPGDWPYEEKILGWMERPLKNPLDGDASYVGTMWSYDPLLQSDQLNADYYELTRPGVDAFCDTGKNQCDPAVCDKATYGAGCDPGATQGTGPCTRSDFECWWHYPSSWCSLLDPCHSGTWEYSVGAAEPPAATGSTPAPACSVSTADVPAGSYIVDSQASDVNLRGCTSANRNWSSTGSFAFSYGDPLSSGSQKTDMDVHQLGAGLGGHMWFTHTNEPTTSLGVSYWGVTGTWSPTLPKGRYQVKVFVPNLGATATEADYTIDNGLGTRHTVTVNQNASDGWVTLDTTWLGPGSKVSLTNLYVTSGGDLAFSGMAFVPVGAGKYAMIGDSYSSGEGSGSGNYDATTDNYHPSTGCPASKPNCVNNAHRSTFSYSRYFAANTSTFSSPSTWVHVACSGAVAADFTASNPNGTCPDEPAQETSLSSQTSLITLTFGGNDLSFKPVITACAVAGLKNRFNLPTSTCQSQYGAQLTADIAALTNSQGTGTLDQLYDRIRADAPNAEVVVLGYPHLFVGSDTGSTGRCLADFWTLDSDQDWLNTEADYIDLNIKTAAARAGFDYLSTTSLFTGHEVCSSTPWITGIGDENALDTFAGYTNYLSVTSSTVQQQFFHPNIDGYAHEAGLLAAAVQVP